MEVDYNAIEQQVAEDLQKPKSRRTQIALYADPAHLVYELLQNADDHGATEITFNLHPDRLIVEHNAKEKFEDRHIRAITSFEESTSQGELLKTGKFGLGFKSVFALTATPRVHCGNVNFEIYNLFRLRGLEPPHDLPHDATRFVLPFNHLELKPEFIFEDDMKSAEKAIEIILEKFEALEDITLLFTRSLRSIRCIGDEVSFSWRRTDNANDTISIRSQNQTSHFRLSHRDITWKDASHRPVEIAIRLDDDGLPVPSYENLVVTFPTSISTGMGIILNGPYRTTPARETVGEGDTFNEFLVEETASLLGEMICAERDSGRLSLKLLEILPLDSSRSDCPEFFSAIHSSVRQLLVDDEIIPASAGGYVCGSCARMARGQYLADLYTDEQLTDVYESSAPLRWVSKELTETNTPRLYRALAGSGRNIYGYQTGAKGLVADFVVRPENIFSEMTNDFLEYQDDSWVCSLYCTLNDAPPTARSSAESCPIIRLSDGTHIGIKANGLPSAYLPVTSASSRYRFVSAAAIAKPKAREYLESLDFREPDLTSEVIEHVLPKYRDHSATVPFHEHLGDLHKVAESLKDQSTRHQLINVLRGLAIVSCTNAGTAVCRYKKASDAYFRSDGLYSYFEGNEDAWFVSPNYENAQSFDTVLKPLFIALGIRDGYPREDFENKSYGRHQHGWHERGLKGFHPHWNIDGLAFAVKHPTVARSAYIWNVLVLKSSNRISGSVQTSTRQEFPANATQQSTKVSVGGELLREFSWIPNTDGCFLKATEVGSIENLHGELTSDEDILAILDEGASAKKKDAAEVLDISVEMLDFFRKYPDEIEQLRQLLENREGSRQAIENSPTGNRERRRQKLKERRKVAPVKQSEKRLRSVAAYSRSVIDRQTLFDFYMDDEEESVICQMCVDPMPFTRRGSGDHCGKCLSIFSKRWAENRKLEGNLSDSEYTLVEKTWNNDQSQELKVLTSLNLVLCPVCFDLYREYIHNDPDQQNALLEHFLVGGETEFIVCSDSVRRDNKEATLKFNPKHLEDIRDCLRPDDRESNED